jgi:uncharacterized protein (DUF697 family)
MPDENKSPAVKPVKPVKNEDIIKMHENAIYTAAFAAAAVGVPGAFAPFLDVTAVGGIWATMMVAIATKAGRQLDKDTALKIATAILTGASAYVAGSKLIGFLLHFIPGAGSIVSVGVNSLLNFLYTFRLGRYLALKMEKPEFDTGDFADVIPEMTTMVFSLPSITELRSTWQEYSDRNQQFTQQ